MTNAAVLLAALLLLVVLLLAASARRAGRGRERYLIYPYLDLDGGANSDRGDYYALTTCPRRGRVPPARAAWAGKTTQPNTPWGWGNGWLVPTPDVAPVEYVGLPAIGLQRREGFCASAGRVGDQLTGPDNIPLYDMPYTYPRVLGREPTAAWDASERCVSYCSQASGPGTSPEGPAAGPTDGSTPSPCVTWCR